MLDPAVFDAQRAHAELVAFLDVGLRESGTAGAERAAHYLLNRLESLGVEAGMDVFTNATPRGPTVFRNVIARVRGSGDALIILGSHYDTKSGMPLGFEGANDSGSSTAVLLELARVLASISVPAEILFAFFDGEECMEYYGPNDGLHGSRRLAQQLVENGQIHRVKAVIILDMIGDCDLTVTIPRNSTPELVSLAFDAAREESVRSRFSLFRSSIGDDHEPFLNLGLPAIDLIDFEFGSAPKLNDYWHTGADRRENVCAESLGVIGRVTLRMVNRLLGPPVSPPHPSAPTPRSPTR